jgi:DNA primase catalytic core
MARIPDSEVERIKSEVAVERLIASAGVALARSGKDRAGRCPFHADDTASLVVTSSKNLFHCFGCGAAGGPIDWLMRFEKLSFRAACERLRSELGIAVTPPPAAPLTTTKLRAAPLPLAQDVDGQAALRLVLDYYHETLKQSPEALDYLAARGLHHPELVARFRLGYANRTLGYRLPAKAWKEGQEVRGRLQAIGLLRESGHEHFNGSLVVPVADMNGVVHEVYGRKIGDRLRAGTPAHLYLPGAHAGVWNEEGIAAGGGEVILCEALIDAMTFWVHGLQNVTASYGANGFTDDHMAAFARHGVKRVLIAYDRDDAGNAAAETLAARLTAEGMACYRVCFPKGMDANEYALKVQPAAKSLALLVRKAAWMGEGRAPALTSAPLDEAPELVPLAAGVVEAAELPPAPPEPTLASPLPPAPPQDAAEQPNDTDLVLTYGERRYRVRGWKKPLNPEAMKVNLLVSKDAGFHVDSFDLYQAKARAAFIKQAGVEIGEAEDVLKHDLGRVLLKLEELQAAHLAGALKKEVAGPALTEGEHAAALELLRAPGLMARILADFDACGVVGEETNKLVGYLAAVSRQLDKPLAVLIQSSSAAGKSSLMDAVLALMPEEAQVRYSAMTGQSLFYMGETNLKHKILAIAEEEGAAQASYALKLLQSDGQVSMASTGKDATTGLLTTHEYKVQGPVMLFLTTTAIDIDEELLNRCVVLTVNESREQTRAIHALQRQRQTLEGMLADEGREAILTLHRNAQRLLQPVKVVNPFADRLTFMDDKTRTRRDHMKYLSLIRAIAFLHQHQREIKTVQHRGQAVRYIEVIEADIAIANRLAHEVLGRTLDELPPQTRKLLTMLHAWVREECERQAVKQADFRFSRRQVRELTGWGDTQLRVHLGRLAELEYLFEHGGRRGQLFHYELAYAGQGEHGQPFLMGLLDVEALQSAGTTPSSRGSVVQFAGPSRPQNGGNAGRARDVETGQGALNGGQSAAFAGTDTREAYPGGASAPSSYRSEGAALVAGMAE